MCSCRRATGSRSRHPESCVAATLFDLPVPAQVMVLHAGFAVGAARRSLNEITELARTKVRAFTKGSVAQSMAFQRELAEAHARVAAARLYVYDVARRMQDAVGRPEFTGLMLEGRAASRYATDVALDVATWAYRRGGGTSLRLDNPLQRIVRDLLAASQHVYVEESAYIAFGASHDRGRVMTAPAPYSRFRAFKFDRPSSGVLRIWIDTGAPNNGVTHENHREFGEVWRAVAGEDDVRAVVVRGTGGIFCGGGDMSFLRPARR